MHILGAYKSTAASPVLPVVPPIPSKSPAPPIILIAIVVNTTPPVSNDVYRVNDEMIDNMSLANECKDESNFREVDDFESLEIDFNDINEMSLFSPSSQKTKLLTLITHL